MSKRKNTSHEKKKNKPVAYKKLIKNIAVKKKVIKKKYQDSLRCDGYINTEK